MADSKRIDTIKNQQLFDRNYYLEHNRDVASRPEIDPLSHYLDCGAWEGRNPHPLFDSSYYLERNPHLAQDKINPLVHFLTEGAQLGLDPHPLFSTSFYLDQGLSMADCSFNPLIHYLQLGARNGLNPHPLFDSSYYLQQVEQLAINAAEVQNPLMHYLSVGAQLGLEPSPFFDASSYLKRYPDVAAAGINPLLHYAISGQSEGRVGISPGASHIKGAYFQSALERLRAITEKPFTHLVITGALTRGGSVRCACSFAMAFANYKGLENVLFLISDNAEITCADWLPPNTRIVNLAQLEPALSLEDRSLLILDLLSRSRPRIAMGFNSEIFWSCFDAYIDFCRENLPTRLVGYLGGYEDYVDMNGWGFNDGPINRLLGSFDLFVTDNDRLRNTMLKCHHHLPAFDTKVVTCYKSLTDDLLDALLLQSDSDKIPENNPRDTLATGDYDRLDSATKGQSREVEQTKKIILWASRLDRVKQPQILARIAEQMPDLKFEVYGRIYPEIDLGFLRVLANVNLLGEYADFSAIPTRNAKVFLHTSSSDSMPHVLVEAAAAGLPIVAPDIGAIGELIDESTGWLIKECDNVDEYVLTIRNLLDNPDEGKARADRLLKLVSTRHNWSAFLERVGKLDLNLD